LPRHSRIVVFPSAEGLRPFRAWLYSSPETQGCAKRAPPWANIYRPFRPKRHASSEPCHRTRPRTAVGGKSPGRPASGSPGGTAQVSPGYRGVSSAVPRVMMSSRTFPEGDAQRRPLQFPVREHARNWSSPGRLPASWTEDFFDTLWEASVPRRPLPHYQDAAAFPELNLDQVVLPCL
jgi:hypothetical protein